MLQTYIACLGQGKNREKQLLMADEAHVTPLVNTWTIQMTTPNTSIPNSLHHLEISLSEINWQDIMIIEWTKNRSNQWLLPAVMTSRMANNKL